MKVENVMIMLKLEKKTMRKKVEKKKKNSAYGQDCLKQFVGPILILKMTLFLKKKL